MTILSYWNMNKYNLMRQRKWVPDTVDQYSHWMDVMIQASPEIISKKPMTDVTYREILSVLSHPALQRFSESTRGTMETVLRDIFQYAELEGVAEDLFSRFTFGRKTKNRKSPSALERCTDPLNTPEQCIYLLRAELEKRQHHRRSLNLAENRNLLRMIDQNLLTDGGYIALAILHALGPRPCEALALQWGNLRAIPGHNDIYYFEIFHEMDRHGKRVTRTKTQNGFRKLPIPQRLSALLWRWKDHCEQSLGRSVRKDEYIACPGQNYGKPLPYVQLATFAKKTVFPLLDKDLYEQNALEMALEELLSGEDLPDTNVTLYVLRRNFLSMIQAATQLNELERQYLMGHEMEPRGKLNLRRSYNNPDLLWHMGLKLEQLFFFTDQIPSSLVREISIDQQMFLIEDTGLVILKATLNPGEQLVLHVHTREPGDSVQFQVLNDQPIDVTAEKKTAHRPLQQMAPMNREYSTWQAIQECERMEQAVRGKEKT